MNQISQNGIVVQTVLILNSTVKKIFFRSLKLFPMGIKHPDYETYISIYLHSHNKNPNGIKLKGKMSIICQDSIPLQRYFCQKFNGGTEFGYEDFYWRDHLENKICKDNKPLIVECEVSITTFLQLIYLI